ncbi:MAG TPA: hypothetical protein VFE98_04475 [Candidatus Bathyarchaeia archaeon]|nr:hypothetical protein [Candidatus Bathyarchaeia archaeon]
MDIPYPFQRVWDAAWTALPLAGWELNGANRALGHFDAKVGMSIWTWGEDFTVNLEKLGDASTRIQVWGECGQSYDWGKTRQDIDRFISLLQITLTER